MSQSRLLSLVSTQPDAHFLPRLSALVQAMIEQEGWVFGCETSVIPPADIAAPDRLLPLVLHRSSSWMRESMGHEAPMDYRLHLDPLPGREVPPICSAVPEPNRPTASLVTWALFIRQALGDWVEQHAELAARREPVPLDSWYQDWVNDLDSGRVELLPALPRQVPTGLPAPSQSPLRPAVQTVPASRPSTTG